MDSRLLFLFVDISGKQMFFVSTLPNHTKKITVKSVRIIINIYKYIYVCMCV